MANALPLDRSNSVPTNVTAPPEGFIARNNRGLTSISKISNIPIPGIVATTKKVDPPTPPSEPDGILQRTPLVTNWSPYVELPQTIDCLPPRAVIQYWRSKNMRGVLLNTLGLQPSQFFEEDLALDLGVRPHSSGPHGVAVFMSLIKTKQDSLCHECACQDDNTVDGTILYPTPHTPGSPCEDIRTATACWSIFHFWNEIPRNVSSKSLDGQQDTNTQTGVECKCAKLIVTREEAERAGHATRNPVGDLESLFGLDGTDLYNLHLPEYNPETIDSDDDSDSDWFYDDSPDSTPGRFFHKNRLSKLAPSTREPYYLEGPGQKPRRLPLARIHGYGGGSMGHSPTL
ncbi:hypothetical protein TWF730_010435 [Orbilia blumenaviensis]|uniref:Cryptic loci regulator 2 N-terminal domain-containing protein n=1 Tax=Orbilia blumenaviensis TaxID=1796055 RepID=A0AAV9UPG8_9PEZI